MHGCHLSQKSDIIFNLLPLPRRATPDFSIQVVLHVSPHCLLCSLDSYIQLSWVFSRSKGSLASFLLSEPAWWSFLSVNLGWLLLSGSKLPTTIKPKLLSIEIETLHDLTLIPHQPHFSLIKLFTVVEPLKWGSIDWSLKNDTSLPLEKTVQNWLDFILRKTLTREVLNLIKNKTLLVVMEVCYFFNWNKHIWQYKKYCYWTAKKFIHLHFLVK